MLSYRMRVPGFTGWVTFSRYTFPPFASSERLLPGSPHPFPLEEQQYVLLHQMLHWTRSSPQVEDQTWGIPTYKYG
jgi:hypothetical protein